MSTRANIVVKDSYDEFWFYRHSDGYPQGTLPLLRVFMRELKEGRFRDNAQQSAGWLVVLGAVEYNSVPAFDTGEWGYGDLDTIGFKKDKYEGWKVGAIEPTTGVHGDTDYLYEIDVESKTLTVYDSWDKDGRGDRVVLNADDEILSLD